MSTARKFIIDQILKKMNMTEDSSTNGSSSHADTIIRNHVIWAMGSSFIPIIVADILAVTAVQMDMIRQLCKAYNVDFKEQQGKAIISSLTTSTLSRLGARSLVKMIPVVGSFIGGVAVSVFAGASTYALGEVFKHHFEKGGTILDFDVEDIKQFYDEKFEKGKTVAKEWSEEESKSTEKPATSSNAVVNDKLDILDSDTITKLRELAKLKEEGVINDAEFQELKKRLMNF